MLEMLKPVAPMNISTDDHHSMLSVFTGHSMRYLQVVVLVSMLYQALPLQHV